jgi:hypothetical protein
MIIKDFPDHHDAEIVIKLYELRREAVMREARKAVGRFLPKSFEEVQEFVKPDTPTNPHWRQVSSYWEMAYGMVKHGVLHADFMIECNGAEGLFVLARFEPFLEQLRAQSTPTTLANTEWVAKNTDAGRRMYEQIRARIDRMRAAK